MTAAAITIFESCLQKLTEYLTITGLTSDRQKLDVTSSGGDPLYTS